MHGACLALDRNGRSGYCLIKLICRGERRLVRHLAACVLGVAVLAETA